MLFILLLISPTLTFGGVLYPWGPSNGDVQLPTTPDDPMTSLNVSINLTQGKFNLFNSSYTSLALNKQGIITFTERGQYWWLRYWSPNYVLNDQNLVSIFPLLSEVDPYRGVLSWRESTTRSLLLEVTADVKTAFPSLSDLSLDWALVVTWSDLSWWEPGYYYQTGNCSCSTKRNTFQAVLASSGPRSFVVFNYEKISWDSNPWSDGWEGASYIGGGQCGSSTGGQFSGKRNNSVAGFSFGPQSQNPEMNQALQPYVLPGSVLNLTERSNLQPETKGRWVFRVDRELTASACDFADHIEQVRVDPGYICQLGQIPLKIRGPCLLNVSNVECRFIEGSTSTTTTTTKGIVSQDASHVICPAPILQTSHSRVKVELGFTRTRPGAGVGVDGGLVDVKEEKKFIGSLLTYPPNYMPGRKLDMSIATGGEVRLSWSPSSFPSPPGSPLLLQLTLVVLDLTLNPILVPPSYSNTVKSSVFNTGSYSWSLGSIFRNPRAGYFAYLTTVDVDEQTSPIYLYSGIVYTSITASPAQYAVLCDEWYWKDPGLTEVVLPPCPPLLDQAAFDWAFFREMTNNPSSNSISCYRQRVPSTGGSCQRCAYSENDGRLLLDPPNGATAQVECSDRSLLLHEYRDVLPLHLCSSAGVPESLAKYFERRRSISSSGVGYVPPRPWSWRGDPHFTTWDNVTFTFNPVGEFWLVKGPEFGVQARIGQYGKSNASVFTGFVLKQKSPPASVQVTLGGTGLRVWINGDEVDPPTSGPTLYLNSQGVSVSLNKPGPEVERVNLAFSFGFTFDIGLVPGEDALNVGASVAPGLKNKSGLLTGLLGDYDGNPRNDFRNPVGVVGNFVMISSSLTQINKWGLDWRTREEESNFIYFGGKSHADYQNLGFTPNLHEPNISSIPRKILDLCGGLRECLWDYGTTGSLNMAKGTKEMALGMEEMEQIFKRKPPLPCTIPHCVDTTHYTPRPTTPWPTLPTTTDSGHIPNPVGTTTKKSTASRANLEMFTFFVLFLACFLQ